jgi:hypothetical protein
MLLPNREWLLASRADGLWGHASNLSCSPFTGHPSFAWITRTASPLTLPSPH